MDMTAVSLAHQAAYANENLLQAALVRLRRAFPSDRALGQSMPLPDVVEALQDEGLSAIEVFAKACEAYGDRPAFGERAFQVDGTAAGKVIRFQPAFRTLSYRAAWRRTVDLATGLVHDPRTALRPGEIAGIYGFGSTDYVVADLACLYAGVVTAVLQMGMAAEDLRHLAQEAGYACLICSREGLPAILELLPDCPSVRSVVVMDLHPEATDEAGSLREAKARTALPLTTLSELAAVGQGAPPLAPFIPPPGADPLATLMYTSGSTGFPKGALLTQRVWRSHWLLASLEQYVRFPQIGINFYPLSHAMGRNAVVRSLLLGGVMHFTLRSDLSTLFEDIRLVRPTSLALVPRVSELIHQEFRNRVRRAAKAGRAVTAAEAEALADLRATFLGDRLVAMLIGSAPTSSEVLAFLARCFEVPIYEGYGSTEAGVITLDGEICRPSVLDYKLVDVPELGYRLSDRPHPRGELLVKTRHCVPGYFQNPEATRALYDADGFMKTGDIVQATAPEHVTWIDRKGNVVKLAQGEYVTLWRLEALYSSGGPFLDQVYLYANSLWPCPLAVVVPHWTAVNERLRAEGPTPGAVKQLLRGEFNRIAAAAGLRPYEVPRDFLVESGRWTRENGYLTGIGKPARPALKRRYGERLEALYAQLERQTRLEGPAAFEGLSLADKVRKAAQSILGVADLDLAAGSFTAFGGDSISALAFANLLEEACGTPVPVAPLLNPAVPLSALVHQLEVLLGPGAPPTFRSIHAGHPRAEDLRLARLMDPAGFQEAGAVATQTLASPVRTVLLTGASGFLGRVLCLAWLDRMAKVGGKVIALVRASNAEAASERLRAACRTDPGLERRFETAAAEHLEVLAGDFTLPDLGLDEADYGRLAREVDLIVHAGALVNHVYTYEQLFEPNVLGTARLLRLALQQRRKRFDFVSTIGVLAGARAAGKVPELAGVDALWTEWPPLEAYAYGYATSKWAGEVLMKDLHEHYGTPVRVFRPGLILPHRTYRGQVNAPDLLTRLLVSLVRTGLAPASFYRDGGGPLAHFDGLPVDFIAEALVELSSAFHEGIATFQVCNPHEGDGVSLDTLVDWVRAAGYPLERVAAYDAWFEAFSDRVRDLGAPNTVLPILHQWARPSDDPGLGRIDTSRFRDEVERHRPGGEASVPHLTEGFIRKYLEDLKFLGLLNR